MVLIRSVICLNSTSPNRGSLSINIDRSKRNDHTCPDDFPKFRTGGSVWRCASAARSRWPISNGACYGKNRPNIVRAVLMTQFKPQHTLLMCSTGSC